LAIAICRHAACAVEQREINLLLRERRQEIGKRGEDRQTYAPAVAVLRPEKSHLPHNVGSRYFSRELAMHGLGDYEAEVMSEAVCEPRTPVRGWIGMTGRGLHPDFAITQFDRELR
jgi:hypothetical protein